MPLSGQPAASSGASRSTNSPIILTVEGTNVFVQHFQSNAWESAYPNQILATKDRGRTGLRSRTSVQLSDLSVLRIGELSEFEIKPLPEEKVEAEFSLLRGLLYLLNRDRPGKHRFVTPTATAATRGTEFNLEVDPVTGRTVLTVLEGEAELTNTAGAVIIGPGEQGIALLGQRPTKTARVDTTNVVQWCLYYPAVLDPDELGLGPGQQQPFSDSLQAYRSGDLLGAVSFYPQTRTPATDAERIYVAALFLSVGQVAQAESMLAPIPSTVSSNLRELTEALRLVIAVVNRRSEVEDSDERPHFTSASGHLAESYRLQSEFQIEQALAEAKKTTEISPRFAFGWVRVAELEFSLGRSTRAAQALEEGLSLGPRNAQAVSLKGFLLAAQNRLRSAEDHFNEAIRLDGGLGNAWLGRGLCRIRRGQAEEGRLDLQVAATTEPQRSVLRSYLGKAFSEAGDHRHAEHELRLAREIDSGDPTPWLYSALLLQQQNRINEGIRDIQRSQELNDNRQVYRSRLLLDQDRAVRGANLANLYRDAGLAEVSVREAIRSVNSDYANYSAHLFLANSLNLLRDPKQVNQRYESAWFSEYLLANLLAPAGAGTLSQTISDQEYSRLFEGDRFSVASTTAWLSHGEFLQSLAHSGLVKNSEYSVEMSYRKDNGWRPNNELERSVALVSLKHEITARDSLFFEASLQNIDVGDVNPYYRQSSANRTLHFEEQQEPFLLAGYHRQWTPASHTLLLVGRFDENLAASDMNQTTYFLNRVTGPVTAVAPLLYEQQYRDELELYSAELQHIWNWREHTLVLGGRLQAGEQETHNEQSDGRINDGTMLIPIPFTISQSVTTDIERESLYAYDQWNLWPTLQLFGGITYDRLRFPENYRLAPVSSSHRTEEQLSPKGGLIFTPLSNTTVRAAYYQSLSGVGLEQSVRLEPSQIAGFNQALASVAPEGAGAFAAGQHLEGWTVSLEQELRSGTYLGVSGEFLESEGHRTIGMVQFQPAAGGAFSTAQFRQNLDFREQSFTATFNQLISREWSLGARYRVSRAELDSLYPGIPATAGAAPGFQREESLESILHQVQLNAIYNHASGFFAGASAIWNQQSNRGYTPDRPGDDFWQFNVEGGWRFFRRRLEVRTGLRNITDQDYRMNPLNLTEELPREREVFLLVRVNF
jgi:tetratricopeptide (TPR) repeat protein